MSNDPGQSPEDEEEVKHTPTVTKPIESQLSDSRTSLNNEDNNTNNEDNAPPNNEEKAIQMAPIPAQTSANKNNGKVLEEMSSTQQILDKCTGEAILQRDIPNKIIVARGKKISFYYERARRVLRLFDGMIVTGFGTTVCIACSLVEVLKRNQMAVITHIETKLDTPINYVNINENYNPQQQYYYRNAPPQTAIEFHLKVGKYGKHLSGYHQRKIIELFEKYDQLSGFVSVKDVCSMRLYQVFHSNTKQIASAEAFINDESNLHGINHSFILPDFIRYCSLIIHPLMKDNVFKKILYQHFTIGNYYMMHRSIRDPQVMIIPQPEQKQQQQLPPQPQVLRTLHEMKTDDDAGNAQVNDNNQSDQQAQSDVK
eukprot:513778_1